MMPHGLIKSDRILTENTRNLSTCEPVCSVGDGVHVEIVSLSSPCYH